MYTHPFDTSIFDMITVEISNPAAGANFSFLPNTLTRILPVVVGFTLTTDATAADRLVQLQISDGSQDYAIQFINGFITASLTVRCTFFIGAGSPIINLNLGSATGPLPDNNWIRNTGNIDSLIGNIQATDQISDIQVRFQQQIKLP